jgi:hypothetical protein
LSRRIVGTIQGEAVWSEAPATEQSDGVLSDGWNYGIGCSYTKDDAFLLLRKSLDGYLPLLYGCVH